MSKKKQEPEEPIASLKDLKEFPLAKPRRWINRKTGKNFKVLPWFQPAEENSRFDFKGLMQDIFPEYKNDIMGMSEMYSGLVIQCGWQLYNDAGVWFCIQRKSQVEKQFKDVGYWVETTGPEHVPFPLTKESVAKAKALKKKKQQVRP